jgi:hypothetical protein
MAMHCRTCNSKQTRVTCTEIYPDHQRRYIRCFDCDTRFITKECYIKPKPGPKRGATRRNINYALKGESNPLAILQDKDVYAIRQAYDQGLTYMQIKSRFGIASSTYYRIGKRTSWSHLPERQQWQPSTSP